MIKKHSISSIIDINYLSEYMREIGLNSNEYEAFIQLLTEDIQNKNELSKNFEESVRKTLNALVSNITDNKKREKVEKFIHNEV